MLTGQMIPQTRCSLSFNIPFANHIVYIQGSNEFKSLWSGLVKCGGGEALIRYTKNSKPSPTVVVTDGKKRPSKTTISFGVPVVSQDWLMACAIRGETVEAEAFKVVLV